MELVFYQHSRQSAKFGKVLVKCQNKFSGYARSRSRAEWSLKIILVWLRNLLDDQNSENVVTPFASMSTAYLVSTQGNCTSSSKTSAEVLEKEIKIPATRKRLKDYFCSDIVFNLSKNDLTKTEIKVLKRSLGFVPKPNLINEENLGSNCKLHFRKEPSENFVNYLHSNPISLEATSFFHRFYLY